jgi:hypothetical protein
MASKIPEHERHRLFSFWCDGALDESEAGRLDEAVRTDPEFRKSFLEYMDLHATLSVDVDPAPGSLRASGDLRRPDDGEAGRSIDGGDAGRPGPRSPGRRSRSWARRVAPAAALAAGMAALLFWWGRREAAVGPRPTRPIAPATVRRPGSGTSCVPAGSGWRRGGPCSRSSTG